MPEPISATDTLFSKGVLIDLTIGRWTGQKKLKSDDLGIEGLDTEVIYLGHKKLLPKEALEPITNLEARARVYLANHSVSFPIGGANFIFNSSMETVLAKLDEFHREWDAAVNQLIEKYPQFKEQQLVRLDADTERIWNEKIGHANDRFAAHALNLDDWTAEKKALADWMTLQKRQNRTLYPAAVELREYFSFKRRLFKISAADGITGLSKDEVEKAQVELKLDLQKWVKDSATAMHQALGEAAKRAMDMLEKNGELQPRNLRPLFNAISTFQSMDFTQGSETLKTVEEIRKDFLARVPGAKEDDFEITAERMKQDTDHVKELLSKMSELAVEGTAREVALNSLKSGEFARCVDL